MRIMVVSERLPSRVGGGRIRQFNLIRELAKRHDFTLVCYLYQGDTNEIDELRPYLAHLETVPSSLPVWRQRPKLHSYWQTLSHAFFDPFPHRGQFVESPSMNAAVQQLLATRSFDLIQVHQAYLMRAIPSSTPPVLLDMHDILSEHERRYSETLRKPVDRALGWIEWRKMQRLEHKAAHRSALCTTVSDEDKQKLLQLIPDVPVMVVPNGVDLTYFEPRPSASKTPTVVFTGSMNYGPNVDAVLWFYHEILPVIRRKLDNIRFIIVGYEPPPHVGALEQDRQVTVTGYVQDVRPYIAEGSVVVVPLRHGSGTRLKILEAWAMGKAVVSTRLGAEGLPAHDGENILLAETPTQFAQAVLRLLGDTDLRERLGQAGHTLVKCSYGWNTIAVKMEQAYHAIVQRTRPSC